jgi:predicted RNA-binding Zn ribbon-like protein
VNTLDPESGADRLASAAGLAGWLAEKGLSGDRATRADLRRAVEVREALRRLLLANNGEAPDPGAPDVLDAAARAAGLAVRFGPSGAELVAAKGGAAGALGRILAIVAGAMADGTWTRMKACRAGTCLWAFYDHSKNRSRTWCSMAVCGNRTKVRKYRGKS